MRYLGDENGVDFWVVLKILEDLHSLALGRGSVNVRSGKMKVNVLLLTENN